MLRSLTIWTHSLGLTIGVVVDSMSLEIDNEPSLDDLRLFASVVESGSFTAAARVPGISKQSVSQRIGRLESQLGVALLTRTTRRMKPTHPGRIFYGSCRELVEHTRRAQAEVQRVGLSLAGHIKVTAPVVLGEALVVTVAAELMRKHPEISVELELSDRFLDLTEEACDAAIRVGPFRQPGYRIQTLGHSRQYYVASPDFCERHGSLSAPNEAPCIARSRHMRWPFQGGYIAFGASLVASTFEARRRAALEGLGVALLPIALIAEDLEEGRLVRLYSGEPAREDPVHLIVKDSLLPRRVETFADLLCERAAQWPCFRHQPSDAMLSSSGE